MIQLKPYEKEVILLLTREHLPKEMIDRILNKSEVIDYYTTGVGYFLTLRLDFHSKREVFDEPLIIAESNNHQVGFIVFLEGNELTLECHGWGDDVPEDFRDKEIQLKQPN